MGMQQPYFCCDRCVCDEFVKIAGDHAEGVVCTYPWNPTRQDPKLESFRAAFRDRFGEEPETYAAHAYDGMNMLIWAVQVAGLNRARIRDVLAYLPHPWPGVTGEIPLSACLDDVGDTFLARRENGAWKYYSRADLAIPGYIAPRDRISGIAPTSPAASDPGAIPSRRSGGAAGRQLTLATPPPQPAPAPFARAGPGQSATRTRARGEPPEGLTDPYRLSRPASPAAEGGDFWRGATLALDEANAEGGFAASRSGSWWAGPTAHGPAARRRRLVFQERVWAIVGRSTARRPTSRAGRRPASSSSVPAAPTRRNLANVPMPRASRPTRRSAAARRGLAGP
jgi:hypothetical protein